MQERYYSVYIMANQRYTVLYTGVTNNIFNRSGQHKSKIKKNSFTAKYNVDKLIENFNPKWRDLFEDFYKK